MSANYGARLSERTLFSADASLFSCCDHPVDLIESMLQEHRAVRIPALPAPLVLTRPIRLESGMYLSIHEDVVLRMGEGCGGCMVRNAHVQSGIDGPIPDDLPRDSDIIIEGGQWEFAPRTGSANDPSPVMREFCEKQIILGVAFFSHAERVTVRGMTIRKSEHYGVLLADCRDFLVEHIFYDRHNKDGVHVNGPASHGLIQHMHGWCGDDFVALNAWDWDTSSLSFGAIRDIAVRHIACEHDEMRILPGRKTYRSGVQADCPVENCRFEDISGAYNFKLYQQPNCHNLHRDFKDFSDVAGLIRNVTFSDIRLSSLVAEGLAEVQLDALFEMGADCENITFENLQLGFTAEEFRQKGMSVAIIGPKSSTWTQGHADPAEWTELFEPDLICTADGITFRNISFAGEVCTDRDTLLREQHLAPNPDYPRTTPKGGTGYGVIRRLVIEA